MTSGDSLKSVIEMAGLQAAVFPSRVYAAQEFDKSEGEVFGKEIQARFMSSFCDKRYNSVAEKLFVADFEQIIDGNGKVKDGTWFYVDLGTTFLTY